MNELVINATQRLLRHAFNKSRMDNLITRVPSDIAGNEFAVHTDSLAGDAILNSLCLGDLLEAFVKKVHAFLLLILADLTAESIIRIYGWTLFIKSHHTKGTAIKQIESALLIQLLVAATASLFEYHH